MLSNYVFELVENHKEALRKARPSMKDKMEEKEEATLNLQGDIYSFTYYKYH